MAYNEELTGRIRAALAGVKKVEEKRMFRGVTFMVNDKMCISAGDTRIMCRIDPALHEAAVGKNGVTTLKMKGREYRGFVYIDEEGYRNPKDLKYWIDLALDFNKTAKASKKKAKSSKKKEPRKTKAPNKKK
jgi:TfoX/Sxy family transcriptional regulator of competence genes